MVVYKTNGEYQEWAIKNHPQVIEALKNGGATITVAPDGFMFFGDKTKPVKFSQFFIDKYDELKTLRNKQGIAHEIKFGDYFFRLVDKESMTYLLRF